MPFAPSYATPPHCSLHRALRWSGATSSISTPSTLPPEAKMPLPETMPGFPPAVAKSRRRRLRAALDQNVRLATLPLIVGPDHRIHKRLVKVRPLLRGRSITARTDEPNSAAVSFESCQRPCLYRNWQDFYRARR